MVGSVMSSIILSDGRKIQLFRLYQRYTYEGVLAGLPDDERNSNLCHEAIAHARARPWLSAGAPVTLIRPKVRREQAQLTPRFRLSSVHQIALKLKGLPARVTTEMMEQDSSLLVSIDVN